MSFMNCIARQLLLGRSTETGWNGRDIWLYGGEKKLTQSFVEKPEKETPLEDLGLNLPVIVNGSLRNKME